MNYAAEMNSIIAQYTAASQSVRNRFSAVDAHTARGGAELAAQLRQEYRRRDDEQQRLAEARAEAAARKAQSERERLLQQQERTPAIGRHRRDEYALPSDWTAEDEAREQGFGRPNSWLT